MQDISLMQARFLSLGLTTFLYGTFFTLFMTTTAVMTQNVTENVRRQRKIVLPVSFTMFLVATVHLVVVWIRGVYGFLDQKDGSTLAFYEDIADPTNIVKMACLCLQSALGDCVMIWRMYIVYGKRILVVIPGIVFMVAYTAIACFILSIIANARAGANTLNVATFWITIYFSLTMVTHIICSGAIAWRISITGRSCRSMKVFWPIVFVIVESSALYTLGVVTVLATLLSGSNAQYPAMNAIVPLVGIVFSLIMLQIRFHVSALDGQSSDNQLWDNTASTQTGAWTASDRDPESRAVDLGGTPHVKPDPYTRASG